MRTDTNTNTTTASFSMSFALENALEYVNVMVFVDDDMLSVVVDAPIQGEGSGL